MLCWSNLTLTESKVSPIHYLRMHHFSCVAHNPSPKNSSHYNLPMLIEILVCRRGGSCNDAFVGNL